MPTTLPTPLVLERLERDGGRVAIRPQPAEIHAAVTGLDSSRDVALVLRGTHDDGARYELSVTPATSSEVVVSLAREGERRWLARGDDATPRPELDGLPGKALVPRTWGSSVLALATQSERWPPTFPWHDAAFVSLGALALDAFSFARCAADASTCVPELARAIAEHVRSSAEPATAAADVVAELRRVGHDLWSLDTGGYVDIWGSDYMRRAEGQGLYLELSSKVFVRFGDSSAEV